MNNTPEITVPTPEKTMPTDIRPVKKNVYTLTHGIFALLSLIIGSVWFRGTFRVHSHNIQNEILFILFVAIFIAFALCYYRFRSIPLNKDAYILLSFIGICTLPFAIYYKDYDSAPFASLAIHLLVLLFFRCVSHKNALDSIVPDMVRAVIIAPFSSFGALFMSLGEFFRPLKKFKDKENGKKALSEAGMIALGVAVSVPILAIIISLLSSDDFFANYLGNISDIFSKIELPNIIEYFNVISLLVSLFIFGALYSSEKMRTEEPRRMTTPFINKTVATTVKVSLLLAYILFALAQIDGFASVIAGKIPAGETYSAFARGGFFDLCRVALINGVILYCSEILSTEKGKRVFDVLVVASTYFLIFTAAAKMILYILAYGFTPLRILTLLFMLLLSVVFAFVLAKFKSSDFRFSRYSVYAAFAFIAITLFVDFEALSEALNSVYFPDAIL